LICFYKKQKKRNEILAMRKNTLRDRLTEKNGGCGVDIFRAAVYNGYKVAVRPMAATAFALLFREEIL
jgi:hypothetical protein